MNSLNEIAKNHDDYIQIVKTFGGYIDPQDVVQEMYIRIDKHLKKHKKAEINLFYIWTTLRNVFCDIYKVETKTVDLNVDEFNNLQIENNNLEQLEAYDKIETKIDEVVHSQHYFDAKLFELYRSDKTSIRKLSKATNISTRTIHWSLAKTKKLIENEVKESYEDYLNEDYELI